MQVLTVFGVALAVAQGAMAKEMAKNEKLGAELYDSGLMMDRIMTTKQVSHCDAVKHGEKQCFGF
jgi:hypothetical protein